MTIPFKDNLDKSNTAPILALVLLHAVTNAHLLHWQSKSYAQHVTLGEFYSSLSDVTDDFIEAYMGKYGQIQNPTEFYSLPDPDPVVELKTLFDHVYEMRQELPDDSELQNLLDEIADLIDSTLYKLRFLK